MAPFILTFTLNQKHMAQEKFTSLPKEYWVHNDGDKKQFAKLLNEHIAPKGTFGGSYTYYLIKDGTYKTCQDPAPETSFPVLSFAEWKDLIDPPKESSIHITDDYSVANLKGKNVAIHCRNQGLWNKVVSLIPKCRLQNREWDNYKERSCITHNEFNGSYGKTEFYKDEGYQIITAEEFIAANEKKHEYKVDDWVVVTDDAGGDPVGTVTQIIRIDPDGDIFLRNTSKDKYPSVDKWVHKADTFRPATQQEIDVAKTKTPGYKVGDWVCILPNEMYGVVTKGINPETPYKVKSVEEHCLYLEEAKYEPLSKERFRHATPDEISKAKGSTTSKVRVDKTNAVIGLKVVRGKDWNYSPQDGGEGNVGVITEYPLFYPKDPSANWTRVVWANGDGYCYRIGHDNKYDLYVHEEQVVSKTSRPSKAKKDSWKVGDVLPDEFLNLHICYTKLHDEGSHDEEDEAWDGDRTAKEVSDQGWVRISGSSLYLRPKDQYPDYEKYLKPFKSKYDTPIGWKPGDSWRHRGDTCGLSISVHPKDDNPNLFFVDYGESGTAWIDVNTINDRVAKGIWIINPEEKSKKQESQTTIFKQSKTKQNENTKEGISISTEQCIISKRDYKPKSSAYLPADSARVTAGPRRKGTAVRG